MFVGLIPKSNYKFKLSYDRIMYLNFVPFNTLFTKVSLRLAKQFIAFITKLAMLMATLSEN